MDVLNKDCDIKPENDDHHDHHDDHDPLQPDQKLSNIRGSPTEDSSNIHWLIQAGS